MCPRERGDPGTWATLRAVAMRPWPSVLGPPELNLSGGLLSPPDPPQRLLGRSAGDSIFVNVPRTLLLPDWELHPPH